MGLDAPLIAGVLPSFVHKLALAGDATPSTLEGLATQDRTCFDGVEGPGVPPHLDAIYFDAGVDTPAACQQSLRRLRLRVHRWGTLFVLAPASSWQGQDLHELLGRLGLDLYHWWEVDENGLHPLERAASPGANQVLFRLQRNNYDPVAHARIFLRELNYYDALSILLDTPSHWLTNEEQIGMHAAERMACYLAQDRFSGEAHRLLHLVSVLHAYTLTCTYIPEHVPPYLYAASFWKRVGRPDLGRRLLQTVATILPSPEVDAELEKYVEAAPVIEHYHYPEFDAKKPLRILYLCHADSDYGADLLYDGMRRLMGADSVIEYPWKPTVHGQRPDEAFGYPCTFGWPDGPRAQTDIVRMAAEGAFDVILFSDTFSSLPGEEIRPILEAAGDTPLFIVDTWDECGDYREEIRRKSGLGEILGYFKREMVAGIDYGPRSWPLPFAYADDRIPDAPSWERREGAFFAGKLIGGARRLQMSWLTQLVPINGTWGTPYTQEEYVQLLQKQLVGICLFGNGFDTVRYWELPAHGVLLLADRSPLIIPNDFQDGKQAVFFDHAGEMREKLEYYLAHPGEAVEIARAGHAHLLEYHTATARARQFLGKLQEELHRHR